MTYKFTRISDCNLPECTFWTEGGSQVTVELFEKGVATLYVPAGSDINEFCQLVAECADKDSNFGDMILGIYGAQMKEFEFKGIQFTFNGKTIYVPKGKESTDDIIKRWRKALPTKS